MSVVIRAVLIGMLVRLAGTIPLRVANRFVVLPQQ
jgi:hypothetical protein